MGRRGSMGLRSRGERGGERGMEVFGVFEKTL